MKDRQTHRVTIASVLSEPKKAHASGFAAQKRPLNY